MGPIGLFGNAAKEVHLVGYIDQTPLINLGVTLLNPPGKALLIQSRLTLQGRAYGVNDKVQEVRVIATITVRTSEDNPIGSSGFQKPGARGSDIVEEVSAGPAVPGGPAAYKAAVHCIMI